MNSFKERIKVVATTEQLMQQLNKKIEEADIMLSKATVSKENVVVEDILFDLEIMNISMKKYRTV